MGEKVPFDAKHINEWIEGGSFQILTGSCRGKIVKLNRTPVSLEESQIDIVDFVHSFVATCSMKDNESLLGKSKKRR